MEPAAQAVLAVAGVSVSVILGALLAIARRDRGRAGGRTSAARIMAGAHASQVVTAAPAPQPASAAPQAPGPTRRPPVTAAPAITGSPGSARRPRFGRRVSG